MELQAISIEQLDKVSDRLTLWITDWIERRIQKAYPKVRKTQAAEKTEENVFAQGCDFYKLLLLFVIGAFLGDIVETVFCRITMGYWMSRSSLVWGPFSIVWGLALALVTWFLYKYKDRSESFLFLTGTLLGCGAVCFEGNIDFYGKSGFRPASDFGIRYHGLPEDEDTSFFLCKELIPGYLDNITGEYATPVGYFVDEKKTEEFDKTFPYKEKKKLPGQLF